MAKFQYMKLHILQAKDAEASIDREKTNIGHLSFTSGDDRYVFVLDRSDLEALALQIQQLFDPVPPSTPRRKGRKF
jgi:hypothetical protein